MRGGFWMRNVGDRGCIKGGAELESRMFMTCGCV